MDLTSHCFHVIIMRPLISAAGRFSSRYRYTPQSRIRCASTTGSGKSQRKVQTPLQSQNIERDIPEPLKPRGDLSQVQTPIQTQHAPQMATQPIQGARQPAKALGPIYVFFIGITLVPLISYAWYLHRKEHMDTKWEGMLKEAEQKRVGK
jgi:hypothetical protein